MRPRAALGEPGHMHCPTIAWCHRLAFFSPPLWPHWRLFDESGFVERRGDRRFMVIDPEPHDARAVERWQLVPGDQDAP